MLINSEFSELLSLFTEARVIASQQSRRAAGRRIFLTPITFGRILPKPTCKYGTIMPGRVTRRYSIALILFLLALQILSVMMTTAAFGIEPIAGKPDDPPTVRTVAILLFEGAELMDVAGPAEVFIVAAEGEAFRVLMVSDSTAPLRTMGGVAITPDVSFAGAPRADVIVVPGGDMKNVSDAGIRWLLTASADAEIVMSVCMGAFVLARAGLLDGIEATTHHWGLDKLQKAAPGCKVQRGRRFVDSGKIITTAGVTAGIDGALHVVARLLGAEAALWTADEWMEHPYAPSSTAGVTDAELSHLAFIAGAWRGEMKGGVIEERWSAPEGDNMMGMFRLVKDGEGVFYEFMSIEQAGDTPVLRIRHFGQGLEAWEEKDGLDPYPLVELGASRAVFGNEKSGTRLVYECPSPDILKVTLEKQKDGKKSAQVFIFKRN